MLVYIHVPFCKKKCLYCAFYSVALHETKQDEQIDAWLQTLLLEIENFATSRKKENKSMQVETIFFGGGTPSILEPYVIDTIISKLKSLFTVDAQAEISLESNPDSLDRVEKIKDFLKAGINRISLGVQTFDDIQLSHIGRVHSKQQAIEAFYRAKEALCKNINIDLIWGLPSQNIESWLQNIDEIIKLQPEHISAYSLTIEEDTPFASAYNNEEDDDCDFLLLQGQDKKIFLPNEQEISAMYTKALEIFQKNDYFQYEISNYSKVNFQCKHNLGYWSGIDYIGFGPSAASTIDGTRFVNHSNILEWQNYVQGIGSEIEREILSLQDRAIELIMLRLRTSKGLELKSFTDLTGRDFLKDNKQLILALEQNQLVHIDKGYFSLTQEGFIVSNAILRHLFENTKKFLASGLDTTK